MIFQILIGWWILWTLLRDGYSLELGLLTGKLQFLLVVYTPLVLAMYVRNLSNVRQYLQLIVLFRRKVVQIASHQVHMDVLFQ